MTSTHGKSDRGSRGEFILYSKLVFVTYTRSRINDKEEFHECLFDSLERSLARDWATYNVSVEMFGSKELHKSGIPHYHVVLRFSRKVYWPKARRELSVWILVNGHREIDTESIYIRKKKSEESDAKFLRCVQTYIAKKGDVFGRRMAETEATGQRDPLPIL